MIICGILAFYGTFDNLIHEMNEISNLDLLKHDKKISWKETKVYDNSNRGKRK